MIISLFAPRSLFIFKLRLNQSVDAHRFQLQPKSKSGLLIDAPDREFLAARLRQELTGLE
jgi:hypothetical protein